MCGLVAVVSKSSSGFIKSQCEMFHELLYVDNFRGDDSTGVFMVDRTGDLEMIKEASSAPDFVRRHEFDVMMRNTFSRGRAIVGHNRKATKGTINDVNAHPFVVDDKIVLVHNGTLYGDYKKLAGAGNDVDVDSHAIAHIIHQKGDDVEAALQEVNGAYALIWFDMEKQTLNFIRNAQRPLHFLDTGTEWVWASEKNMLDWMVSRHNLKGTVAELKAGNLCSFHFTPGKVEVQNKEITLTKSYFTAGTGTTTTSSDVWTGFEGYDGCAVNPLACGYDNMTNAEYDNDRDALRKALEAMQDKWDEETGSEPTSPFEAASRTIVKAAASAAVSPPVAVIDIDRLNKPHINAKITAQHRADEAEVAAKNHCHISAQAFSLRVGNIHEGERYRIHGYEYQYLNLKDGSDGYLLYGWLAVDDSILVRLFIRPDEIDELVLLDWTTNQKDLSVTLTGKLWRSFENKDFVTSKGDGFAMMYARHPALIKFEAPKKENAVG